MPHLEYVENILGHENGHKFPQTNCIRGGFIFFSLIAALDPQMWHKKHSRWTFALCGSSRNSQCCTFVANLSLLKNVTLSSCPSAFEDFLVALPVVFLVVEHVVIHLQTTHIAAGLLSPHCSLPT